MSTFHSDVEQSLGLFVCFCKIPLYFYREGKRTFRELYFIRLSYKKGQCMSSIPYGACLYMQGAHGCPRRRCWPLLVATEGFLRWVPPNPLPFGLGEAPQRDRGALPNSHETLNAAKHKSGWGRRKHTGCKPPTL